MTPHVIVFPLPVQGHITPTMHFSQKLAARGIMVTFVTTAYRLMHIRASVAGEALLEEKEANLCFVGLDDGLPDDDPRSPVDMAFIRSVESLDGQLEQLVLSISRDPSLPPVTCIVSDSFLPWTLDVALKLGLPRVLFWTMSMASCCAYTSTSKLIAGGYDPFLRRVKGRGEKALVTLFPGLPHMDPYDLAFNGDMDFLEEETENTKWLRGILEFQFQRVHEAAWFIANSFQALEAPFIDALCSSTIIPRSKLLLLGPLCEAIIPEFRGSLWKEQELDCLQWLDTQKDASVLYISFGSVVLRTQEAIQDVAKGLLACRQPFLWALRSGWDEARGYLGKEFWGFAMEAGKLTTWTPQLKVLSHGAVGGFLSHAGWNSTIESVSKGVPMLAWPCFLDQFTNSWEVSCQWGMGVQLMRKEGEDGAKEVEEGIRMLMQSEQRVVFQQRAVELQAASMGACAPHLDVFVEDMFRRAAEKRGDVLQE
ncbi:hypothetical protein GOP47_0028340 [Adiantum capillus-veneris]|nr:hypothetical protein GOP47_0028340 [Adiantum capillus-veneris]